MATTKTQLFIRSADGNIDDVVPVTDLDPLPARLIPDADNPPVVIGKEWVSDWVQPNYGATSGALDANDALGDIFVFEGCPVKGRIITIKMLDQDDDTLAATVHIFSQTFTAAASDAAFTVSAADGLKWEGSEAFDAGTDLGSFKGHVIKNANVDYTSVDGRLFAQLSSTGTPNIASAAVMPRLKFYIQAMA